MTRYYAKDETGKLVLKTKRGFATKDAAAAWELSHKGSQTDTGNQFTFSMMFEEMCLHSDANDVTNSTRRNRLIKYAPDLWNRSI